ncbi:Qat anti-phage system associated protein QatB [Asticcacaulis benevestitus]|nr:Qat anti-phage system associated protein QatB [Asticcacaulis benevestitus]
MSPTDAAPDAQPSSPEPDGGEDGGSDGSDETGDQGNEDQANPEAGNGGEDTDGSADTGDKSTAGRHRGARGGFTSFAKSGGSSGRALGRAIASYVRKTAGGSRNAARRMATERSAAVRLANLLSDASTSGIREVARILELSTLANRPVLEIYAALVDVVCGTGGQLDDSIARDAYINAVGEIAEIDGTALEHPSIETVGLIMEHFITNTICDRLMNAIATQIVTLPQDIETVQDIERQMKDFVRGAVSDAVADQGTTFLSDQMKETVDSLYERTFSILHALAEEKAKS